MERVEFPGGSGGNRHVSICADIQYMVKRLKTEPAPQNRGHPGTRTMAGMRVPLWLKVGWSVWLLVWVPVYWHQYGSQNFLYFCDLGNFFIAAALWGESPLLFSWQACGLLFFQSLYALDLMGAVLSHRHIIGGTEYVLDSHLPLFVRLLALFHLLVPALLLWAIWRLGYDGRGWKFQTLTAWIVIPISYFWRPQFDVNWARGLFGREQHGVPGMVYLAAYLVLVPLLVYWPTHLVLEWGIRRLLPPAAVRCHGFPKSAIPTPPDSSPRANQDGSFGMTG